MINIETLLSSFDERGTLLKWLKAVESALKDAVLTSVDIVTISSNTIQLKFNFEDGTSITTPSITLPKGDTGETGATGNGISSIAKTSTSGLVDTYTITFTDGTTTTFDVTNGADGINGTNGTNGTDGVGISSVTVDASNHLIVTLTNNTQIDAGAINVPTPSNVITTDTNTQLFNDNKILEIKNAKYLRFKNWLYENFVQIYMVGQDKVELDISTQSSSIKFLTDKTSGIGENQIIDYERGAGSSHIFTFNKTTGGQLALLSDISAKVPDAPTTDGTYQLKCTVSSGTVTYSWEAVV